MAFRHSKQLANVKIVHGGHYRRKPFEYELLTGIQSVQKYSLAFLRQKSIRTPNGLKPSG